MAVHLLTAISRFLVDVIGDAPTSGIPVGSRAYSLETSSWFVFDGAAWAALTAEYILTISTDDLAAIGAATAPTALNPFATKADITAALAHLVSALPAADPHVVAEVWNDAGVLKISIGAP
jgi:hypothetical protein